MTKRRIAAIVLCLLTLTGLRTLTGCSGDSTAVPQTAEEVGSFDEVLAFLSGQTEVDVTEVQVRKESEISPTEPVSLSEEDAGTLLSLLETPPLTLELYEPVPVYGGSWYSVICTLENGETVTLYPKEDALTCTRAELNEEGRWYYPTYRLFYEDAEIPEQIYTFVTQHWME